MQIGSLMGQTYHMKEQQLAKIATKRYFNFALGFILLKLLSYITIIYHI